jgi:hypothetical protein
MVILEQESEHDQGNPEDQADHSSRRHAEEGSEHQPNHYQG